MMKNLKVKNFFRYQSEKFAINLDYFEAFTLCAYFAAFDEMKKIKGQKNQELDELKQRYNILEKKRRR